MVAVEKNQPPTVQNTNKPVRCSEVVEVEISSYPIQQASFLPTGQCFHNCKDIIHMISVPRPSPFLLLFCLHVLYWMQTKEQKQGRTGNEAMTVAPPLARYVWKVSWYLHSSELHCTLACLYLTSLTQDTRSTASYQYCKWQKAGRCLV